LATAPKYVMDWVLPRAPLPSSGPQQYDKPPKRANA